MKSVLLIICMLSLGVAGPIARAETGIPFFHHHKKEAAKTTTAPKPKTKRGFLHRGGEPTRAEAAQSEAAYGMTGPRSVGFWHKQPGPAGVGAN